MNPAINFRAHYILLVLFFFPSFVFSQTFSLDNKLFNQDDTATCISRRFSFTEGPATDLKGNIYFTDQPNNRIWKYSTKGKLQLYMKSAGRSNGLYLDKRGRLFACADADNELWRIDGKKRKKVILTGFEGKAFNGPNDLWIASDGRTYFTDPYYQRPYWTRKKGELSHQSLYYLAPGSKEARVIDSQFVRPNGIIGTADGKWLYVADIGAGRTYRYGINADGSLSARTLFTEMGSDGMTVDALGNVYLTGKGVTIFNNEGQSIGHIDVPEKWTANVTFGGRKKDALFITASEGLYRMKMKVRGSK